MIPALVGVGVLLLAAAVPGPARGVARAVLAFAVLLAPVAGLAAWMATWDRVEPGSWLLLGPAMFIWLASVDLRYGMSARVAKTPVRSGSRGRGGGGDGVP